MARAEEASGGAIVWQKRQTDGRRCSLRYGLATSMAVEVSGRVSWIGRVDLNAGVFQFGGELDSQHVERGLRSAVTDESECSEFRGRVADLREGTKAARDVDDAA